MSRIAIIEDTIRLAVLIQNALDQLNIKSDIFQSISEAGYGIAQYDYDLLIIDRGLPDGDGLDFLRKLRATGFAKPCLVLTAYNALHDRVLGLDSGADDYLVKPFAMEELQARLRALLRRPTHLVNQSVQEFCGVTVDMDQLMISHGSLSAKLSSNEMQALLCLSKSVNVLVRHRKLEHAIWGVSNGVTPNALDVTIHRLRKRLTEIKSTVKIVNVRGQGYVLELP